MDGIFHLLYVTVIVDMVHAVAVVAIAFGAVTKFHVWMICIGHAAYGAFVEITLSGLNILLCLFEVDGLGAVPMGEALLLALYTAEQFLAKEQEVVQNSKNGQQGKLPVAGAHVIADVVGEESGIKPGQPLDFERNQTVKKNAGIRIKGGEGEEHGKINILRSDGVAVAGGKINDKAVDNGEQNTGEEINVEAGSAPLLFKGLADEIIEIEENEGKITCGVGDEHKGYDAPDLPFQYHGGVKLQKPDKGMGGVHKSEKPDNNIGYDNVYHQVGDSEAGVLIAEKIDFSVEPFHWPCQLLFQHT